jgi:CBS-domain-containing membrane protein
MGQSIYDKRVKEIVTQDAVTLTADDTIHEALELMCENRVSALPVIDERNRCVGILSTSDLVDLTRDADQDLKQLELVDATSQKTLIDRLSRSLGSEQVQSYMSEALTTVSMETMIGKAAREMLRNRVHHLPVVDLNDRLVGIISTMDILGAFVDAAPD